MHCVYMIVTGYIEWAMHAAPLLAGFLPGVLVALQRRGFGGGGFGRRRSSFGGLRILFVLLFTTALGPIVLVALLAFIAYRFYVSRQRR